MFAEKNGKDSIFSFNRENRDDGQIKQTIFSGGFFVTNKLIILYGIPLDTEKSNAIKAEEIEKLTEDIMNYPLPSEVLLICLFQIPNEIDHFKPYELTFQSLLDSDLNLLILVQQN